MIPEVASSNLVGHPHYARSSVGQSAGLRSRRSWVRLPPSVLIMVLASRLDGRGSSASG